MSELDAEALGRLVEDRLGVSVLAVDALAGGMGTRRFFRVRTAGEPASLIARVEAPEDPASRPAGSAPEPPLEPLRRFLAEQGLPVPARHGGDEAAGVELLEDLGDRDLARAAHEADASERDSLYTEAVALVPQLQRLRDPGGRVSAFGRHLDATLFAYKAELFATHSLPSALGRAPRPAECAAVSAAFAAVAEVAAQAPARLAHRDFQSQNLLVREGRPRGRRVAMIDIQGAFLAPPEYDLVCLLRDSYVELPAAQRQLLLDAVRPRLPDAPEASEFAQRFDLLTLTRKGKDHARILQTARRGDRRFLAHLPATVRALREAAARVDDLDPRLAPLAEFVLALPETACAP